ncbi:hypothetical protein BTR14_02600 [Rhizobium rhizosphaerae]|uniref:TNase-like domain-containing protein n=1 Tax=Xaviernesmea rhizosphaerae TaxID=1672749 RepID=A0ABX3PJI4_9HYPH|nr:thermonuclease family protein [Xaviernesmea rhizosphaerae]OQP88345.1 hypothetical protein BTR14_02600 [Xaviernesmea rhizosphaerae]
MTVLVLAAVALLVAILSHPKGARSVSGRAQVVDGDTLVLSGRRLRIRLVGIDAPERAQTCILPENPAWDCGEAARHRLEQLIDGRAVTCEGEGQDRYGRLLAHCRAGETALNAAMVEAGFAVASGDFRAEEARARLEHRGLWASRFTRPQIWRRMQADNLKEPAALGAAVDSLFSAIGDEIADALAQAIAWLWPERGDESAVRPGGG